MYKICMHRYCVVVVQLTTEVHPILWVYCIPQHVDDIIFSAYLVETNLYWDLHPEHFQQNQIHQKQMQLLQKRSLTNIKSNQLGQWPYSVGPLWDRTARRSVPSAGLRLCSTRHPWTRCTGTGFCRSCGRWCRRNLPLWLTRPCSSAPIS